MRYAKITGIAVLALLALFVYQIHSSANELLKSLDPNNVIIGAMSGHRLRIPAYYLDGTMEYEGQSVWDAKSPKITPTPDTPIKNFAIMVRLSNFEPLKTQKDKGEYLRDASIPAPPNMYEKWLVIGFELIKRYNNEPDYRGVVKRFQDDKWQAPFIRQKERVAGLLHDDSSQGDNAPPGSSKYHRDFFYDDEYKRMIACETDKQVVEPFAVLTYCHHYFDITDLGIQAKAYYTKKDLPRWKEIEEQTNKIIHSFVVKE